MVHATGSEFLVNDRTDLSQSDSAVTALAGGGFVIGWIDQQSVPTTDEFGEFNLPISDQVRGRAFNSSGAATGNGVRLSSDESGRNEFYSALEGIMLDDGDVAFVWRAQFTDSYEERARTFAANLIATSDENRPEFGASSAPRGDLDIAASGGDDFLLGSLNDGTIRTFLLEGETRTPTENNTDETKALSVVDLQGNDTGLIYYGPVVNNDEGLDDTLNFRRLAPNGEPNAASAVILSDTGAIGAIDTARLNDGNVVVVFSANGATSSTAIIIDPMGTVLVGPFTAGGQSAEVAALAGGGFAIAWTGSDGSGSGIEAQVFAADGTAQSGELQVNAMTQGNQFGHDVAGLVHGGFVVSWTDASGQGGDASGTSIKARVFTLAGADVPLGAIASGAGNETFRGTVGSKDIFFFDTADGQSLGRDVIKNFGAGDRIVTTSKIFDANNDGVVRLDHSDRLALPGAVDGTNTGSVKIFYETQKALSTVVLLGTETHDGSTYYVYGGAGNATAQPGLMF